MSTTDNGAIDYRQRLRERKRQQDAATVAATVTDAMYDPPLEHGEVISAEAVLDMAAVPAVSDTATPVAETVPSRTPQVVREQAKAAMTQLLSVTDAEYTAMMTELSTADPILYAAVVDEINDARAAATKTA